MIEHNANHNLQDQNLRTPLHLAAERGDAENVRLMIARGAAVAAQNEAGETPLMKSILSGYTSVAALLVNRPQDLNLRNTQGQTALHLAAHANLPDTVSLLVRKKITSTSGPERTNAAQGGSAGTSGKGHCFASGGRRLAGRQRRAGQDGARSARAGKKSEDRHYLEKKIKPL